MYGSFCRLQQIDLGKRMRVMVPFSGIAAADQF
jgi:hypothetical protein